MSSQCCGVFSQMSDLTPEFLVPAGGTWQPRGDLVWLGSSLLILELAFSKGCPVLFRGVGDDPLGYGMKMLECPHTFFLK